MRDSSSDVDAMSHAPAHGFALFDTAIGWCAIAWNERGIAGVQLPEADEGATRRRMQRRFPQMIELPPPAHVESVCRGIEALLRGEPDELSTVRLDMDGVPTLHRRVYDITRGIAAGATLTYGDIAQRLGDASLARAVGQALGRNPFAPIVPCHRVLAAGDKAGGFSAHGGLATKLRLLAIEGAALNGAPGLFDRDLA